jgi:hypothetical protein
MQSLCSACNFNTDDSDNFCRRCGASAASAGQVSVPATRPQSSVTLWRPNPHPVVKGAAVMAAGTVGQFVARRLITGLIGGGSAPRKKSRSMFARRAGDGMEDEAQIITETMMVRRVRIRRPT